MPTGVHIRARPPSPHRGRHSPCKQLHDCHSVADVGLREKGSGEPHAASQRAAAADENTTTTTQDRRAPCMLHRQCQRQHLSEPFNFYGVLQGLHEGNRARLAAQDPGCGTRQRLQVPTRHAPHARTRPHIHTTLLPHETKHAAVGGCVEAWKEAAVAGAPTAPAVPGEWPSCRKWCPATPGCHAHHPPQPKRTAYERSKRAPVASAARADGGTHAHAPTHPSQGPRATHAPVHPRAAHLFVGLQRRKVRKHSRVGSDGHLSAPHAHTHTHRHTHRHTHTHTHEQAVCTLQPPPPPPQPTHILTPHPQLPPAFPVHDCSVGSRAKAPEPPRSQCSGRHVQPAQSAYTVGSKVFLHRFRNLAAVHVQDDGSRGHDHVPEAGTTACNATT